MTTCPACPHSPEERHDPRCHTHPCTCASIAKKVREADAKLAREIQQGRGPHR